MKLSRLLLTVVGATVLLGALVSSASAGRLSNSSTAFNATWARMDFRASFGTVECEITLSGSLHRASITKTRGSLIGYITDARVRSPGCRRGEATILSETLPWHFQYDSFAGALPSIASFRTLVIGFAWRFGIFGIACLMRSATTEPFTLIFSLSSGRVTSTTIGGSIRTTCGDVGTLGGTSNSNSANTVTLI